MDCPVCDASTVTFAVPGAYRDHAPDAGDATGLCPSCLTLTPVDVDVPPVDEADFSRIIEAFPEGEAGVAMALAVGLLVDSLVLNRDAIEALFEAVSDAGEDPWLVLERLHVAGSVQPDADLQKARHQLEQLWR